MREVQKRITIEGQIASVLALMFDESDKIKICKMYQLWHELSENLKKFHSRGINLPEGISESAFCICFDIENCGRALKINRGSSSFDVINFKTNKRIQIKATSIDKDLTSFGPASVWDEIYFLDFFRDGEFKGKFDIYLIPDEIILNKIVNKKKNETFMDQQAQGRRPRLSVKALIKENNISVIKTGDLSIVE